MRTASTPPLLLLSLALAAVGCDADDEDAPPTFDVSARGELVACEGGEYDPVQINAMLADYPELARTLGIDRVDSCEQARSFFAEYIDYVESFPSPEADVVDPEAAQFRIKSADGANLTTSGVLELFHPDAGWCTGVLIHERVALTAAHCVAPLAPQGERNFWQTGYDIRNFNGDDDFTGTVRINIHPDYSGAGDVGDDIAVVKLTSGSFGFSDASRHRIYTDFLSELDLKMYGRGFSTDEGTGGGILRWMWYDPDFSNSQYFLTDADSDRRACSGDSGGPVMDNLPGTSWRAVAGLHVNSDKWNWNECARWNGKQRAVRLQHKVRWIDDMIGGNDHDDCTAYSAGGLSYERCW